MAGNSRSVSFRLIGRRVRTVVRSAAAALVLATAIAAEAQQTAKVPRVGFVAAGSASDSSATQGFRQGLRDLGYVEGKNVVLEARFAGGQLDRLPDLVAELLGLRVDVLVAG